jgi:hypothetical protein
MTLAQMVSKARALCRTDSTGKTDDEFTGAINNGQRMFAVDTHAAVKQEYLQCVPKFDTRTHFAIHFATDAASADVPLASADRTWISGATVASDLTDQLSSSTIATGTVSWSSTTWRFAVNIAGASSIAVSAPTTPTYTDGTNLVFGGGVSVATATFTGGFPEDCMVEASLPSDFLTMEYVEWDQNELHEAPYDNFLSPELSGTPEHYAVKGNRIRLFPSPDEQKKFHIWYKWTPAEFGTFSTSSACACSLDANYHMAPVYFAASEIAEENFEYDVSNRLSARYQDQVRKYITQEANKNPRMMPKAHAATTPRVDLT